MSKKLKIILGVLFVWLSVNFLYLEFIVKPNRENRTNPGEIVATFYNGDGTTDYIRRNGAHFQLEVNYPKSQNPNHALLVYPDGFNYGAASTYDKDIRSEASLSAIDGYVTAGMLQARNELGLMKPRYPMAGAAVVSEFSKLKINDQPIDEFRTYTDSDGKTWYLWYYRDLKLNLSGNQVSFD